LASIGDVVSAVVVTVPIFSYLPGFLSRSSLVSRVAAMEPKDTEPSTAAAIIIFNDFMTLTSQWIIYLL
jgi:hypothetical protein